MSKFLIYYSDAFLAKQANLPRVGTEIEINPIADLDAFSASVNNARLVVYPETGAYHDPFWIEFADLQDKEELDDNYAVNPLPDDIKNRRWIEVYNGYRE